MEQPIILECRNVWKLYGAQADSFLQTHGMQPTPEALRRANIVSAVRNVDVTIRKGEIFVIMGLSGSGKSTLVRCLARLIDSTAGEIRFEGRDLLAMSGPELIALRRHKMGMVFQHFALLPHLTALENAAFPLEVQGIDRKTRLERAMQVMELVGLKGRENRYPHELSGGQQQRVGIARSLIVEPDLWFLDEPFSALDPLIRREMQDELLRLQARLHKTIVFITHDFDEAIRLADRIAVMRDGAIVQTATPEELVLNPADDYVAEFTQHIPRAKVVRLGTAAKPLGPGPFAGDLTASLRVAEAADRIEAADLPFRVLAADGAPMGQIDGRTVIDILIGREVAR
ncbi:ATP-binding cassette domain-containing protein [Gemmobacter lutimaris]|uniref:Quaternary amine transport ATP-binding protein n=1 Tax=Gemmobacter lutimaris TaxID=2306023 RepID=A0A398BQ57_9RHOB|nr:glycine betaine/L-proline ABC transporter ATP-binding protein [Gemmobacter lutimaris]RID92899.1 ATP-binding cassette domain-containing protein [Gemmobacter lutimaris]